MKHTMVVMLALSALSPTPAFADVPGKGWISREKASAGLAKRGYNVTKIEADDGHWEGEAVRKGIRYEFHVNPKTGQITKLERDRD